MPPEPALLETSTRALPARRASAWRSALAALSAAALSLGALTWREWGEMAHQWWNIDTYNHLLLVPFIIGWLVRLKAGELARIMPRGFAPGLFLLLAALALWGTGRASGINLLAHAGAVGALQAAVVSVLGLRAALLLALPIAYAAFLVPFGDEIIPPLQAITAKIAIALTRWSGIEASLAGLHIHTPAGLFVVAEACSGVKFLIAMVTLGVLLCSTRFARWSCRLAFMAACVIVPIFANGVRAWATIYVAQFIGAERATGFDHIVYGWIFFAIVLAALLGAAWRFFEREPQDYGWRADDLDALPWLARAERASLAPASAALAATGLAAVAALGTLL